MEDIRQDYYQMSRENRRLETFKDEILNDKKISLVKAGFFYTGKDQKVKCFSCLFEFDAAETSSSMDFRTLHKKKSPECSFVKSIKVDISSRPKKFLSYDSLRYEKERLETFIEWPVPWLCPKELAADGFYYLRTHDHCACVFCRGIVGAWEVGDTPRGEHKRHFPHCPFIRGQVVGNVSLNHSFILDKLPLDGEECPIPLPQTKNTETLKRRNRANVDRIGLHQYSGPKRKDYVTLNSRLMSYKNWPERVIQKPEQMAEAGFFYCGLSDHVRCFHCDNGLRNWEIKDNPWEEHARWYPNCSYVVITKGQEFIDTIQRKEPQKLNASSGQFKSISDNDLEVLMESDVIKGVNDMEFSLDKIRLALKEKLEKTGIPFFNFETCIEMVLKIMETDTQEISMGTDEISVASSETLENMDVQEELETNNPNTKETLVPSEAVRNLQESNENITDEFLKMISLTKNEKVSGTKVVNKNKESEYNSTTEELERIRESRSCKICMDAQMKVVFLPCKHMSTCANCAVTMTLCPICRKEIKYTINPIIS
jgi:hypothetical protein